MDKLTDRAHWDGTYTTRKRQRPLQLTGVGSYCNRLILAKLLETGLEGKRILEIGAGDSAWLPYLAKTLPSSQCVGLDYSESGCALLSERARTEGASVEVMHGDMFAESSPLHRTFDVVLSFGVVEHFSDLGRVLSAKSRYAKPDGTVFTLIPNMAGLLGTLTRRWNPKIYARHNPHDLRTFALGHQRAGLNVISSGYLGSNNFGVLSGCFPERQGIAWNIQRTLFAISLAVWSLEGVAGTFPSTKVFAPYLYAVSRLL